MNKWSFSIQECNTQIFYSSTCESKIPVLALIVKMTMQILQYFEEQNSA